MSRRAWLSRAVATGALAALRDRARLLGRITAGGLALPGAATQRAQASAPTYAPVEPGRPLAFPRDFGAHPAFRTEWWYVTGWLRAGAREIGVQITFFRSRTAHDPDNPSAFAPKQLLLAHTALAIDGETRLRHDERAARAGFGLAEAGTSDCDVSIGDWRFVRTPQDRYQARMPARGFTLALDFAPPGPPVLQGDAGFSRKGPRPAQASHYYSRPQLTVSGTIGPAQRPAAGTGTSAVSPLLPPGTVEVAGIAWLDHEWSSELLDPRAAGWDWAGLNFDDGSALMAFRIRGRDGGVLWSHARWIAAQRRGGAPDASRVAADSPGLAGDARVPPVFEPLRLWRSPTSGATWPVAMRLSVGPRSLELHPLFDDQELDTRASTGTIYWEGAVRVLERGRPVGRGYLELTGYAGALRL